MKRGLVLIFVSIVLILSINFISASWFENFFGKITGETIVPGDPTIGDTTKPVVTLISPINKNFSLNELITFTCSATDNFELEKVEFWLAEPGDIFEEVETKYINGTNATVTFTKSFSTKGDGAWNCKFFDASGNYDWGYVNDLSPGFKIVNQTPLICLDSDGGLNYYVKGNCTDGTKTLNDGCINYGPYLREFYCGNDSKIYSEDYLCPNGCSNGTCIIKEINESNYTGTCSQLVNNIINAADFEKDGIKYYLSGKDTYKGTWWGKEQKEFTEYGARWNLNYWVDDYRYGNLYKSVMIFDDTNFKAITILEDMTEGNLCQVHNYYSGDDESKVYVCNWNAYNKGINIGPYQWKNRQILWAHNNVLVRFSVGFGEYLSNEQIAIIIEEETSKFLNSLVDNRGEYLGWENFDIDWPFSDQLSYDTGYCKSDIPYDACSPYWQCITEPAICPEYGKQTQTCRDISSCGNKPVINQIECNPGICSGCLVPKWFNSNSFGESNNRCIPYGFRFEHQIGWNFAEQKYTDYDTLTIKQAKDDGEINLSISPNGIATLQVEGWGNKIYTFKQGDKFYLNITGWTEGIIDISFLATEVFYDSNNYENSYIKFEFIVVYLGEVAETINAYCDIDGYIKPQKSRVGGEWAKCQNNYECESNFCSYGECVGLDSLVEEASSFKRIIVQFFCKITHLLSDDNYNQCLIDNLA